MGAKVPGNESFRERKLTRTFVPESERAGPFCSQERKDMGANWPRFYCRFAPGSELARDRKGSVPYTRLLGGGQQFLSLPGTRGHD